MPTTHIYYYVLEHARALGEGAIDLPHEQWNKKLLQPARDFNCIKKEQG